MSETQAQGSTTVVSLVDLIGELEIPCDYSEEEWCPDQAAEWSVLCLCPKCGTHGIRLLCDPCKELLTTTEDGLECPECGHCVFPVRDIFKWVERLDKKP